MGGDNAALVRNRRPGGTKGARTTSPPIRAATPATCGLAIDVPLIVRVPPLSHVDVMLEPGA